MKCNAANLSFFSTPLLYSLRWNHHLLYTRFPCWNTSQIYVDVRRMIVDAVHVRTSNLSVIASFIRQMIKRWNCNEWPVWTDSNLWCTNCQVKTKQKCCGIMKLHKIYRSQMGFDRITQFGILWVEFEILSGNVILRSLRSLGSFLLSQQNFFHVKVTSICAVIIWQSGAIAWMNAPLFIRLPFENQIIGWNPIRDGEHQRSGNQQLCRTYSRKW